VSRSNANINAKIANVGVHFLPQQSGDHRRRILANYCRTHVHGTRLKIVYFLMY